MINQNMKKHPEKFFRKLIKESKIRASENKRKVTYISDDLLDTARLYRADSENGDRGRGSKLSEDECSTSCFGIMREKMSC